MKTYFLDELLDSSSATYSSTPSLPANVLTIGNFDGVHQGHQAMLSKTLLNAQDRQLSCAVMVFEPQPREYFAALKDQPNSAPARLTSLSEKQALLAKAGVDSLIVARFDDTFRSLSAQAFAQMLTQTLNVKALVLGDDFRFGHDRTGDSNFLRQFGLPVTTLDTVTDNTLLADRISSTRIRELLSEGNLSAANQLLGRDYSITGQVIHGDQIGRTLEFPTANIALNRLKPALHGVFGVDVVILDDQGDIVTDGWQTHATNHQTGIDGLRPHSLFGTANIGKRPSLKQASDWRLEVYFPEFSGNLYATTLNVRFLYHLHNERKYDDLLALKSGIQQDVADLLAWRESKRHSHK